MSQDYLDLSGRSCERRLWSVPSRRPHRKRSIVSTTARWVSTERLKPPLPSVTDLPQSGRMVGNAEAVHMSV